MEEKLLNRDEVSEELTWDLSLIYKDEEELNADIERMETLCGEICRAYKGKLDTPQAIKDCLIQFEEVFRLVTLTGNYADLAVAVDYSNAKSQQRSDRIHRIIAEMMSELSFIDSEILAQDPQVIEDAIALGGSCVGYLEALLRRKPYQLHPEAEKVIAALSQTMGVPYEIYQASKFADMRFPDFEAEGKTFPLGYSLFEDDYEYDPRTELRRGAFRAFSEKLRQYENTTASAYNAYVQQQKTVSRLRGYQTIFDMDLFYDRVKPELYHRQIDLIMEKLAPHMRKYARLLKKVHNLDTMTYADLKLPVDPSYCPDVTIEESREYIEKGLAIMGEDYQKMIRTAYTERWVDFAKNQGKSTGGFCESPYGKPSFILLNWNNKMSDVFTLAHELGHAGHFKLCNAEQSIFDTDVARYFVEAPSTMNELLMAHYMLKTNEDKRFRRWVLANMIGNTYYHNFVTHLLEAAYQREVYRIVDAGGSVQAETLNRLMKETLEKFWGDTVALNDGAELTWMRQPHYYMGLYSYSYSAGLTIATQMCKRIETEGEHAVEDWKKVLKAGSTLAPVELAALGGVDITTDAALLDTIEMIGSYIDEICSLTEEIGFGK